MKEFEATIKFKGSYSYEDPDGPSRWKGSHVYDISAPFEGEFYGNVYAEDKERAEELLDDHPWELDFGKQYEYDEFEVTEIVLGEKSWESDEEEEGIGDFDLTVDTDTNDPEDDWDEPDDDWER